MHTQSANAELESSCFRFTARELRSSELGDVAAGRWRHMQINGHR